MVNVLKLANELATIVGKQDEIHTIRRITEAILDYRSMFIRHTIMSNHVIPDGVINHFSKIVNRIENMSNYYISDKIKGVETVDDIPIPIRLYDATPFINISSPSNSITFSYAVDQASVRFQIGNKFSTGNRYTYENEKLRLYSTNPALLSFNKVKISGVIENPLLIKDDDGRPPVTLDKYPIPADMAVSIKKEILANLFPEAQQVAIKQPIQPIKVDD